MVCDTTKAIAPRCTTAVVKPTHPTINPRKDAQISVRAEYLYETHAHESQQKAEPQNATNFNSATHRSLTPKREPRGSRFPCPHAPRKSEST
jgi:hypothetical protein